MVIALISFANLGTLQQMAMSLVLKIVVTFVMKYPYVLLVLIYTDMMTINCMSILNCMYSYYY